MQKLISFHGDPKIKETYLKRLQIHYDADQIIKGQYWENGKGCAVGCTIHSGKHDAFDTELGITWRLAILEDSLFEKLPNHEAKEFPIQFLKSMPVGVDTNLIFKKFIIWNLSDPKEGLIFHVKKNEEKELLTEVVEIYKQSLTEEIPNEVWKNLAAKADKIYAYASAYAYAYAYAYASAYAYAYASPEWQKKFDERILKMRDKLLELMIEAGNENHNENIYPNITKELAILEADRVETDIIMVKEIQN